MAYYFSIDLRGAGTAEVESLLSYWARLSRAHGLTISQLASHLSAWAKKEGLAFPMHVLYGRVLSMCGLGDDVAKMIAIVEAATGTKGLSAGTLAALRPVLSSKCTGAVKRSKAWCPRCYEEDEINYGECYDRLLWAFAAIERCPIHRLRLETTCPACSALQRYPRSSGDLIRCHDCGARLIGHPASWKVMFEPTLGEKELSELILYLATAGDVTFVEGAFEIYTSLAAQIKRSRLLLGHDQSNSAVRSASRPFLRTLLRAVIADGADIVTLLKDPAEAVRTAQKLDGVGVDFELVRSIRNSKDVRLRAMKILQGAAEGTNRLSLASACRLAGVSTGYARYNFPDLSKRITRRFLADLRGRWQSKTRRAMFALLNREWDKYLRGDHRSQDALAEELVSQSSCSTRTARLLIAARVRGRSKSRGIEESVEVVEEPLNGDGSFIDSKEFARIAGIKQNSAWTKLNKYVRNGRLFQIVIRTNLFPAFQFSEKGNPRPVIAAMLNSVRPGEEVSFYRWMLAPQDVLGGLRPVDVLDDTRSELLPDLVRLEFE